MTPHPETPPSARRLALWFGISSFTAVAAGSIVAGSAGIGSGIWGRNLAAWAIGAALAKLMAPGPPELLARALLFATPVALLISLFSAGSEGVHRWVSLGPLRWNVAFLFLPATVVAFAAATRTGSRWTLLPALAIQVELWLQPDASQATAFAAAAAFILLTMQAARVCKVAAVAAFALGAVLTWTRPDPLAPIPEVEGILRLAVAQSPAVAAVCATALAATAFSPLWARNHAVVALCTYAFLCMLMPFFGAFPVPLAGMGMSPIIGFWLGAGMLMSLSGPAAPRAAS